MTTINLPDIKDIMPRILEIESDFKEKKQKIIKWTEEQKIRINENALLFKEKSKQNDIKIFNIFLPCLLAKNISGNSVERLSNNFAEKIKTQKDLTDDNFQKIIRESRYRWESGRQVITDFVDWLNKNNWDWKKYFEDVEKNKNDNFQQDPLLKIKNIKLKVRDLALSEFNKDYIAFDLHIVRVMTRIGLLNYGFELLIDKNLEMGNNPSDIKQYLFLHKLSMKLSNLLDKKISLAELDRIFWHFGRTICKNKPQCNKCPINDICLTGKSV